MTMLNRTDPTRRARRHIVTIIESAHDLRCARAGDLTLSRAQFIERHSRRELRRALRQLNIVLREDAL